MATSRSMTISPPRVVLLQPCALGIDGHLADFPMGSLPLFVLIAALTTMRIVLLQPCAMGIDAF